MQRDTRRRRSRQDEEERQQQRPEGQQEQQGQRAEEGAQPRQRAQEPRQRAAEPTQAQQQPMRQRPVQQAQSAPQRAQQPMQAPGGMAGGGMPPLMRGMPQMMRGMPRPDAGPIGEEQVRKAEQTLLEYKAGKERLDSRIIQNEEWWKLRHWGVVGRSPNPTDPYPASGWLFNVIINKHADAMDNFPEPAVLPREPSDESYANILTKVLPAVQEQADFEAVYSDVWYYKLKFGTGVYGVFWDSAKENGLGNIAIKKIDILSLYWEPGVTDIQQSRNLFYVQLVDNEVLKERYPQMEEKTLASALDVKQYIHDDSIDITDKSPVVDWYYKVQRNGRTLLHMAKFCSGTLLYASENDPQMQEQGFYWHGKYPFVFDPLYPEEETPTGLSYIDLCKSAQIYIDKIDQVVLKHATMAARQRFFVRGDGAVNEKEFAETQRDFVHFTGAGNPAESIIPIQVPSVDARSVEVKQLKIDELKEVSGNRDFNQGGTTAGITAASAIAALQEAGSKLSRDMIKASYRAYRAICYICIDLMRQFYSEVRYFRIVGAQGQTAYTAFNAAGLRGQQAVTEYGLQMASRVPIFDVEVSAQKASPFSVVAENERAKELYGMGFFRPDLADQALAALDMMQFDGIDQVRQRIAQNGTMYQQLMQMQQQMAKMAAIIDAQNGTTLLQNMAQSGDLSADLATPRQGSTPDMETNSIGDARRSTKTSQAGEARIRAAESATPRS